VNFTCNTAEMFSFGPNPTRAKKAWSSSTCLLYDQSKPDEEFVERSRSLLSVLLPIGDNNPSLFAMQKKVAETTDTAFAVVGCSGGGL
jgi:hypothetical protein